MAHTVAFRTLAGDAVASTEPAVWARGELEQALRAAGLAVGADAADLTVTIAGGPGEQASALAAEAGLVLPEGPEALALFRVGEGLVAWGSDARGLVYALTELADRVELGGADALWTGLPLVESPATRVRAIARIFANEKEDKAWYNDRSMWTKYLGMLARERFNRFNLTLGIQYDYPYHNNVISDVYFHFTYPFLLALPGYDVRVVGLPEEERLANLAMLRFIGRECARRGLDFQLGLWTQRYDFDDVPNASHDIAGVTTDNHAPYCRDAVAALLAEVPEISTLTFRIHVEGGIAEGDYGFWRTVFAGVAGAGRPIEINLHAKGLDQSTLDLARETGMPVSVSPKYLAEHMGLPYHASAIREREYPPAVAVTNREQLSLGARKFLRYSYGDMLPAERDWQVIFRIWPGTQRILLWGDPAMAAGLGRSGSFCGSDGIEWMEPLSFKGRAGSGVVGGRFGYRDGALATRYDWQKYRYQYRLWGRLSYFPDAADDASRRYLAHAYSEAAGPCARALSAASRILPLVTQTHGPAVANNAYWPEIYTNLSVFGAAKQRPYGFDMDEPTRFGNAPTFDSQIFTNPRGYVPALLAGDQPASYTPLDVADWLERLADETELALLAAKSCANFAEPPVQRLVVDCQIMAALGRFFAEKYRAACWAELFLLSRSAEALRRTLGFLKRARLAWLSASQVSADIYQDDLGFGAAAHLRGSWRLRVAEVEREVNEVATWRTDEGPPASICEDQAERAIAALLARRPTASSRNALSVPASFTAGQEVAVTLDLAPDAATNAVLHYRHVNQAERWQTLAMTPEGGRYTAVVPASYTQSPYHLQVHATCATNGAITMVPGLAEDLANQPYATVLRQG